MSVETQYDVVVLGAGPAGVAAACEADRHGLSVLVIDEQTRAGGQVYRWNGVERDAGAGRAMREHLAASNVATAFGQRCWHIEKDGRLLCGGAEGPRDVRGRALILATGAHERIGPVPGWTLPGVLGLAAATVLIKAEGVSPGKNVVVAGCGPLLPLVAAGIIASGGKVAAIVDRNGMGDWMRAGPSLLGDPIAMGRGLSWVTRLALARAPYHPHARIVRIEGDDTVRAVAVARNGGVNAQPVWIECDTVCLGDGLSPAVDFAGLLDLPLSHEADRGGWHVACDESRRTGREGIFACGDGAGIVGADASAAQGRVAGLAAVCAVRPELADRLSTSMEHLQSRAARAGRVGAAMARLMASGQTRAKFIDEAAIVCRCENIARRTIDGAIASGAQSVNAIKAATRCGMGPCGGRYCAASVAALLADASGSDLAAIAPGTARSPVRPIAIDRMVADFDYADIPFREPAPL